MLKKVLSLLAFVMILAGGKAMALPAGLDGTRWQTQFSLPGGGQAYCDLTFNGDQNIQTYPSGSFDADGYLTIDQSSGSMIAGTWNRGGQSGRFDFFLNSSQMVLQGHYSSPDTNGMMYPWNGQLSN